MNILVADDHPIFRKGLVEIINASEKFRCELEAGDGKTALQLLRETAPDIAVLDISMPEMNGLEIVQQASSEDISTLFVILTMYKEEEYFNEAMDLGVHGYLLKDNAVTDLLNCLQTVAKGQYYVSPFLSDYLVRRSQQQLSLNSKVPSLSQLTATERQVLRLIADNKTSREIADEMHVSHRTVQNHRNNICQKLGFKGHNKLLFFALQNKDSL